MIHSYRLFPGITQSRFPTPFFNWLDGWNQQAEDKFFWLRIRASDSNFIEPSRFFIDISEADERRFYDFRVKSKDDQKEPLGLWIDVIKSPATQDDIISSLFVTFSQLSYQSDFAAVTQKTSIHCAVPAPRRQILLVGDGRRRCKISFECLHTTMPPDKESLDDLMQTFFISNKGEDKNGGSNRRALLIGHRGSGANKGLRYPQLLENTLTSLVNGYRLGADFVEFDVQLTRDLVPVLYHDWVVSESGLDVHVHGLTLEQFMDLGRSYKRLQVKDDSLIVKGKNRSCSYEPQDERVSLSKTPNIVNISKTILEQFSTLSAVLQNVDPQCGFNVEVKYPSLEECEAFHMTAIIDIDLYCNAILKQVFQFAGSRPIYFSSFHADIAITLKSKQSRYPVFFLTEAPTDIGRPPYLDVRSNSLEEAKRVVSLYGLDGLVSEAKAILAKPDFVNDFKKLDSKKYLFTYGSVNNDEETVKLQLDIGVDGIILDRVRELASIVKNSNVNSSSSDSNYCTLQ